MRVDLSDETVYPGTQDVVSIHDDIVSEDDITEPGTRKRGYIDYTFDHIQRDPSKSIHEQAVQLLRLLSANHCFVDGNKRTALNTTWTFYFINGYHFDYGEEIKAILKLFAVMERMVDVDEAAVYFQEIAQPIDEAPGIDEVTQQLFSVSRQATSIIADIETDLDNIETMEDIGDVAPKARETLALLREINLIVDSGELGDRDIFTGFMDEEIKKVEGIIDDLQVKVHEFENENSGS